jgi:hypothetical protein
MVTRAKKYLQKHCFHRKLQLTVQQEDEPVIIPEIMNIKLFKIFKA